MQLCISDLYEHILSHNKHGLIVEAHFYKSF